MSLTTTTASIKKFLSPIALFFIVMGLVFLIYYRFFYTPAKIQPLDPITIETLPQKVATFDNSKLQIQKGPKSLAAFNSIQDRNFLDNSDSIPAKFKLTDPKIKDLSDIKRGPGKSYSTKEASLIVFKNIISYQKYGLPKKEGEFDFDKLRNQSVNELESLAPDNNLTNEPEITFTKIGNESATQSFDSTDAQLVTLSYSAQINNIPVIQNTTTSVSFDTSGILWRLIYSPSPQLNSLGQYQIISAQNALDNLKAQKNPIFKIDPYSDTIASTGVLDLVNLKTANIAYYSAPSNKTIQPVWLFEGTSQKAGEGYKVILLAPAINPKYFKN